MMYVPCSLSYYASIACIVLAHAILHSTVSIERYVASRDAMVIEKILHDNHELLTYEAMGYPAGSTFKYMNSNNYTTDVIRVDGTTVGFINYCALNIDLLTFHFCRRGFIHLIGIDKNYQNQGYGGLLLDHTLSEFKKLKVPSVMVSVQSSNANALKLYERKGFKRAFSPDGIEEMNVPLSLSYEIDIPAHELPQGNIIQRHPRIFFGCIILTAAAYILYRRYL